MRLYKANLFDIGRIKMTYSHTTIHSMMLYSRRQSIRKRTDQSDKQAFEMRFYSKTVFLIKLMGQIFIFTGHNSSNFKTLSIFRENLNFLYKS